MGHANSFRGKYVMIAGADGATGDAMIRAFASERADIIAHSEKRTDSFEKMVKAISKEFNVNVFPVYFAMGDSDEIKRAIRSLMKEKKLVDVLINNIDGVHGRSFQLTSITRIRDAFETDLFAWMDLTQMILKMMVRNGRGTIVNIVSEPGKLYSGECSAWGDSKSAVLAWTKTLAAEVGRQGIRVNAVALRQAGRRIGESGEDDGGKETVAGIVTFLASGKASFVNGQTVKVDERQKLHKIRIHSKRTGQGNEKYGVLLTGAAGGLGMKIIEVLCERKQDLHPVGGSSSKRVIIACAHRPGDSFEKEINALGYKYNIEIFPKYVELSDEQSIGTLLQELRADQIKTDILINNAGAAHGGFFQTTRVETIRKIYDINLISHMCLTNLLLKQMREDGFGVISNVASIAGQDLSQGNSAYGTSKAAMIEWTKELAQEYRTENIYAFAVAPGLADTRMAERMEEKAKENMVNYSAMQRLAQPREIAEVIAEGVVQAPVFSGQTIRVDGGENRG